MKNIQFYSILILIPLFIYCTKPEFKILPLNAFDSEKMITDSRGNKTSVGDLQLGNSDPSPADFGVQTTMESRGFKGNTFVIGVRSGTVTFYNKDKALITVKYSDFKTMGGK